MADAIESKVDTSAAEVIQNERAASETCVQSREDQFVRPSVGEGESKSEEATAQRDHFNQNPSDSVSGPDFYNKEYSQASVPQTSSSPTDARNESLIKSETSVCPPLNEGSPPESSPLPGALNSVVTPETVYPPMPENKLDSSTDSLPLAYVPEDSVKSLADVDPVDDTLADLPTFKMQKLPALRGKKPYKCLWESPSCPARYGDRATLYRHIQKSHKVKIVFIDDEGNEEVPVANGSANSQKGSARRLRPQTEIKGERKFPCDYPNCHWVFTRSNHILRHQLRAHPGYKSAVPANEEVKPHICDERECNQRFKTASALTKHKRMVHSKAVPKSGNDQPAEGMNLRSSGAKVLCLPDVEEATKPIACEASECDFRCARKDQLSKHIEKVHNALASSENGDENSLNEGSEPQPNVSSAKKPKRPFVCDYNNCSKSYTKYAQLIKHKTQMHEYERVPRRSKSDGEGSSSQSIPPKDPVERPYVCSHENCDWSFKRHYHLERHLECHQRKSKANGEHTESGDGEGTPKSNEWQSRLRQSKPPVVKYVETIALAIEKEKFQDAEEERPFSCDFPGCGKRFKKNTSLESHYVVHSGPSSEQLKSTPPKKRPYEENEATELEDGYEGEGEENFDAFDKKRQRKRKKKKEKGAYVCDVEGCEKKFSRNCELTRHKLNHIDVWPFTCEHTGCGRKFKRKDIYRNHQKTHNKPLDTDGKLKERPKAKSKSKKPHELVTNSTYTAPPPLALPPPPPPPTTTFGIPPAPPDAWNTPPSWSDQKFTPNIASSPVSISIINVCLPPQTAPSDTITPAGIISHPFSRNVPHQMQNWTPPHAGRPTVVQQNWGHPISLNLQPVSSHQNWQAIVTRPSVVQATWSNAARQPEPQNIVSSPTVLETLGLRPNLTTPQWMPVPNNQDGSLPQCRFSTGGGQVGAHPDHREGWTL